jgi:acyl carrier protein
MTKEDILNALTKILEENFEIDAKVVTYDANLVTDLDLDSIDAIDMIAELQRNVGCRFTADDFKLVKTVGDVVNVIYEKQSA